MFEPDGAVVYTPLMRTRFLLAFTISTMPGCASIDSSEGDDAFGGRAREVSVRDATATGAAEFAEWTPIGEWLEAKSLVDRVIVLNERRVFSANALLVEMLDGSLVLCDAPSHAAATRELLAWVDAHFGRRIAAAVPSHYHADASGGNEVLIAAGIPVYGSEETARWVASGGAANRAQLIEDFREKPAIAAAFEATTIVGPDHTFPDGETHVLTFGEEEVHIVDPGPGHAVDNVVTWFPSLGVLFGGCMIKSGDNIGYTEDADLDHWPEAVRSLQALEPDFVIPGHGRRRFGADLLANTIAVVERYAQGRR